MDDICRLSQPEKDKLSELFNAYNTAHTNLINTLDEWIDNWEAALEEQPEGWDKSEAGINARERLIQLQAMRGAAS
jgi:hypothetical protein